MIIRPETPADYAAVASVVTRAFDAQPGVALIIAMQRQRPQYDPELSLVAEIDGKVVGHILFSPTLIRLLDQDVNAVNLSPLAVDTPYQNQGVGRALIEEGHRIVREKGYIVSSVLGHDTYYPKFGYLTGVFGASYAEVPSAKLNHAPFQPSTLTTRTPTEADLPALQKLWHYEEHNVDFALHPGQMLLDWRSPNPLIEALVYLRDGEIVGYTRIKSTEPASPLVFLAADAEAAHVIAGAMAFGETVRLPIHPYSASAQVFAGLTDIDCQGWSAGMGMSLIPDTPFDAFYAQLKAGKRLPGRPIWGTSFDLA